MPYITKVRRKLLLSKKDQANTPGDLNFLITTEVLKYIQNKGTCYTTFNDVLGVLEAINQELYRRLIVPYEKSKILANGDVYFLTK